MLEIIGTFFIIILGTINHFLYDWFNHNKIIGYFTAVNESTWEHLKLVIAPSFIWLIFIMTILTYFLHALSVYVSC